MIQNLSHPEKPYHRLLAVLLVFFSFAMSSYISDAVFERLPHLEDEMAYLYEARIISRGNLVIDTPTPSLAYWQPFVIDQNGNRFGKYTPGWPALLAIGEVLGQDWLINALFAALTVALVYRLGREVYNPDVGVFAAALTAFSPMALLLNGTLMGHTSALFATLLFIYAYWRIERGKRKLQWGIIAGIALGLLMTNRPLTGIAVAAPFIAWSSVRLLRQFLPELRGRNLATKTDSNVEATHESPLQAPVVNNAIVEAQKPSHPRKANSLIATLSPLVVLGIIAVVMSLSIPLLNYQAVGDPSKNLYTLVWSYDRVGFGEGYGRNGHTLERGVRHMRFDLSLMAADLFGWQLQPLTSDELTPGTTFNTQLTTEADYWDLTGISWILLPIGLIVGFRKKSLLIAIWLGLGLLWLAIPFMTNDPNNIQNPQIAWVIILGLMAWLTAPFLRLRDQTRVWTWLLASVALSLVILHLTYWIGSQRYSTRYYFEGLPMLALISALPLAWLANRRIRDIRPIVYAFVSVVIVYSLFFYSLPRIFVLRGFNMINRQLISAVEERREDNRPVLVVVTGDNVRWRSYGALMAMTSPYLDGEIVAARASSSISREDILARFPNRQVIDMQAEENNAWFAGDTPPAVG